MNISHPFSFARADRKSKSLWPCWMRMERLASSGSVAYRMSRLRNDTAAPIGSTVGISRLVKPTSSATSGSGSGNFPMQGRLSANARSLVPMVSRCRKSCATTVSAGTPPDGNDGVTPVISPTKTCSNGSGAYPICKVNPTSSCSSGWSSHCRPGLASVTSTRSAPSSPSW